MNQHGTDPVIIVTGATGTIVVEKQTLPAGDPATFTFSGDAAGTIGDGGTITVSDLPAGTYTSTETVPAGWTLSDITCGDNDSGGDTATGEATFNVAVGETATCTFTNTKDATLVVEKVVVNDNGGTAIATGFVFDVAGPTAQSNVLIGATADQLAGRNVINVTPGTYTVTEQAATGYATSYQNCSGIVLDPGETETCIITNDDAAPSLTLVKVVVNDDGGTAVAADWTLTASGPTGFSGTGPSVSSGASFDAGTYDLSESGPTGYAASDWSCVGGTQVDADTVTLGLGQSATCTVTNNDQEAALLIEKVVVNDNGGTATVTDFRITTSAGTLTFDGGVSAGPDSTRYTAGVLFVDANTAFTLSELAVPGYAEGTWSCTNGDGGPFDSGTVTLAPNSTVECSITNDDEPASLVLAKTVVNDDGGTAAPSAWTLSAGASDVTGSTAGAEATDQAGTYTLSESGPAGYTNTSLTCDDDPGTEVTSVTIGLGETITCMFVNGDDAPATGSITIEKTALGDDGTFGFTSQALGAFGISTTSGSGRQTFSGLAPGDYDVTETVPAGWDLTALSCDDTTNTATDLGTGFAGIGLDPGETVSCTFTNTRQGSITIEKTALGDDGTFGFTSQALGAFGISTTSGSGRQTFSGLAPGDYDVTETVPAGWDLTALSCDDTTNTATDLGTGFAGIGLDPGETVSCTFTNTRQGSITIEKTALGDDGTFGFTSQALGAFGISTTSGSGRQTFSGLAPGDYDVTETVPAGWDLTALSCDDTTNTATDLGTGFAGIGLDPGETVSCTFTNTRQGSITIEKTALGDDGTFGFTSQALGAFGISTTSGSGRQTFSGLAPGDYDVTETVPAGWDLTALSCDDTTNTATDLGTGFAGIGLDPGETVSCTFTNTRQGSITIEKVSDPAGGTGFGFTGATAGTIDDGGAITVSDLPAGTYTSTETVPAGWVLADITCDDGDSTGDIATATATFNVSAGETVTCTFTNWALSAIVVEKVTDPAGDPTTFDFTTDAGPAFSLADGESRQLTDIDPGTYSVSESVPAGWTLADATCDNGDDPSAIDLGADEVVTCTFTNVADRGTITIAKIDRPEPRSVRLELRIHRRRCRLHR